jgi:hypothetical protein
VITLRPDAIAPTQTHNYLLAEPSLPDMFSGKAKLLYIKNENPTLGQRVINFLLRPLMISAAKDSVLKVLRGPTFEGNSDATALITHIKGLGFFEGISTLKVKGFLADAAILGSRLTPRQDNSNTEQSLAHLTGDALNEYLSDPGRMYEVLEKCLKTPENSTPLAFELADFYIFQTNPSVKLGSAQKNKIDLLNMRMEALKKNPDKFKSIPPEVFTKFSEIYNSFLERPETQTLVKRTLQLIRSLHNLRTRSNNTKYFLSFFNPKNPVISTRNAKEQAETFKEYLSELAYKLDPSGDNKSMRDTLTTLADEFLAHAVDADNPDKKWATAEEVKDLYKSLHNFYMHRFDD